MATMLRRRRALRATRQGLQFYSEWTDRDIFVQDRIAWTTVGFHRVYGRAQTLRDMQRAVLGDPIIFLRD